MSLEKLEYPASGTVTDSWLPAAAPVFSDFVNSKRRGVLTRVSAGGHAYSYGTALFSKLFRRAFQNIVEADRAAYENFRDVVSGDFLKFIDDRGVPHKVKFDGDEDAWRDVFNDNWDFVFALSEQIKPHPTLKKIPSIYHRDLLFYAPLANNLSSFSRWDGAAVFTRNSIATYIDPADGLLKTAAANAARFEADGVLIEGSRTNKCLRSEEFSDATWTKAAASIVADASTAPDGAATGDKLIEDSTPATAHYCVQGSLAITANAAVSASVHAKLGTRTWVGIHIFDGPGINGMRAWFDLATGTTGTVVNVGAGTGATISISPAANGYYRCKLSGKINAGATTATLYVLLATGDNVIGYDGDGSSYAFLWGAQFEDQAAFVSSYVKTTNAAVTRNEDNLRFVAEGNASQAQGSAIMIVTPVGFESTVRQTFLSFDDGTNLNFQTLLSSESGSFRPRVAGSTGGASQYDMQLGSGVDDFVVGTKKSLGLTWQTNDVHFYTSGSERSVDSSAAMPPLTTIRLGAFPPGGADIHFGHLRDLAIFVRPLTAADILSIHNGII